MQSTPWRGRPDSFTQTSNAWVPACFGERFRFPGRDFGRFDDLTRPRRMAHDLAADAFTTAFRCGVQISFRHKQTQTRQRKAPHGVLAEWIAAGAP
jgi:hypothetical protein